MSCCARCGECICTTAGKIALNKVWHRGCFRCYNCNRPLTVNSAKIFYGEVYCSCCCPKIEECPPSQSPCSPPTSPCHPLCSVNSNANCNVRECCELRINPLCCPNDSEQLRDVHSCSCIPSCCTDTVAVACRPRSPRPLNYPPHFRPRSPSPRVRLTAAPPSPTIDRCQCGGGCAGRRRLLCFGEQLLPRQRGRNLSQQQQQACTLSWMQCGAVNERCRRCGEKVFAAEKVLSSNGAFHLGCFTCCCCCKPLCVKSMCEASGEIFCKQCYNNYFGIGGYGFTSCC